MKKVLFSLPVTTSAPVLMQFCVGTVIQTPAGNFLVLDEQNNNTLGQEIARMGRAFNSRLAGFGLSADQIGARFAAQMRQGVAFTEVAMQPVQPAVVVPVRTQTLTFGGIYSHYAQRLNLVLTQTHGFPVQLLLNGVAVSDTEVQALLASFENPITLNGVVVGGPTLKIGNAIGETAALKALLLVYKDWARSPFHKGVTIPYVSPLSVRGIAARLRLSVDELLSAIPADKVWGEPSVNTLIKRSLIAEMERLFGIPA